VDDRVEAVHNHPPALGQTGAARRRTTLLHGVLHFARQRLEMRRRGAGCDHAIVGEVRDLADIQDADIPAESLFQRLGGFQREF